MAVAFEAVLLAAALETTPCQYSAASPGDLLIQQEDEDWYYAKTYTILGLPLPELLADFPELQGIEPAASQELLPTMLSRVGASVAQVYQGLTSVAADEQVTQEQCGYDGRVKSSRHLRFGYLILVNHGGPTETIQEYRTPAGSRPTESGAAEEFNVTNNFASGWLIFHRDNQPGTNFRYLGQQSSNERSLYVVGFAERPGKAAVKGLVMAQGRSAVILYQGVAWIDASSFRIVRMRLDLLEPRLDLGLERTTTEIQFGEARISQAAVALWLPQEVTVTTVYYGKLYRNRHLYSNFRLFTVHSTIKPAEPRQPHPSN